MRVVFVLIITCVLGCSTDKKIDVQKVVKEISLNNDYKDISIFNHHRDRNCIMISKYYPQGFHNRHKPIFVFRDGKVMYKGTKWMGKNDIDS